MESAIRLQANKWLDGACDEATKTEIRRLMADDEKELTESFYRTLEFGTGGLRGIMGVGTNRMNIYTVAMATQGLANYLKKSCSGPISVAVAYDCRNNSPLFAQTTAKVFAANGIKVYLFDALRPTPELSFAVRALGCQSGVVITASHNPKEYNGYKAYWNDGAQVIAPHDKNIIEEVNQIESIDQVKMEGGEQNIVSIGEDLDNKYLDMVAGLSLSPDAVKKHASMKIVYTPIHGTGVRLVPMALKRFGFTHVISVPEQEVNDGNFPTVVSPNPEEPAAMKMAVEKAEAVGADLVMATDPDADRQAIAVRDNHGKLVLLNGNQSAALLTYYLVRRWKELGKLKGKEFVVKTIVSTDLIAAVAAAYGVKCYNVLTGFKFIADVIRRNEGLETFIGGGEESFGYLVGDAVRDKDAVASLCVAAECAAWAAEGGKSLWDVLMDMYVEFGLYKEGMVSLTRKGQEGIAEIAAMMKELRLAPPRSIDGEEVVEVRDYAASKKWVGGVEEAIDLPVSDVLQYVTADGTVVSVRPSGTEPKIKFYFGVRGDLKSKNDFEAAQKLLDAKIERIKGELNLL